jgi:hypothetical protein
MKPATKQKTWPKWVRVSIDYDPDTSIDERYLGSDQYPFWHVGIVVTDVDTKDTESLWGIRTSKMMQTKDATQSDLDSYGNDVVADLVHILAMDRPRRLRARAESLIKEAARLTDLL